MNTNRKPRRFAARTAAVLATSAIALGALANTPAFAGDDRGQRMGGYERGDCGGRHGGGKHHGGMNRGGHHGGQKGEGMGMLRGLDLTEEQRDKLFELRHAQMPAMREHHKVVRAARQGLRELASGGNYDQAKAQALAEQLGAATAAIALQRATMGQQVMALLTDEQRAELQARRDRRGGEGRGMGGHGHGMRGQGPGMGGQGPGMGGQGPGAGQGGQGPGAGQGGQRS